jgi:hypothetical protein
MLERLLGILFFSNGPVPQNQPKELYDFSRYLPYKEKERANFTLARSFLQTTTN